MLPGSVARGRVGPALRLARESSSGGLTAALDLGRGASGLRVAGIWTAVGLDEGMQQYAADLWLDLGSGSRLHPVVGAGAALVRTQAFSESTPSQPVSFGAATLRAGLEIHLDFQDTDARIAAEALGALPAVHAPDQQPWLTLASTLVLGF